jgi:hypothetical protein
MSKFVKTEVGHYITEQWVHDLYNSIKGNAKYINFKIDENRNPKERPKRQN